MKNRTIKIALGALCLATALCGCGKAPDAIPEQTAPPVAASPAPAPAVSDDPPPPPSQAAYTYDKTLINPYINEVLKPDERLYRLLFDMVESVQPEADLGDIAVDEQTFANTVAALFNRQEFPYLRHIKMAEGNKAVAGYSVDREEALEQQGDFRAAVERILSEVVSPELSDMQNAAKLAGYFAANTRYAQEGEGTDGYSLLVKGYGICYGYSYVLSYILDQMGIENHITCSTDQSHMWIIAKLDGEYYHLDPTNGLAAFAGSDERMALAFDGWYCGNQNLQTYDPPPCSDTALDSLQNSSSVAYSPEKNRIYFSDLSEENRIKQLDPARKAITPCGEAYGFISQLKDGVLLYSSTKEPTGDRQLECVD